MEVVDLRLILSVEDLHRQLVVGGLLSSKALGFSLSTLLLTKRRDLVSLSKALDHLRLERLRLTRSSHWSTAHGVGKAISTRKRAQHTRVVLSAGQGVLREHDEPAEVLLVRLRLELLSLFHGQVGVSDLTQIASAVAFGNDKVSTADLETGVIVKVIDIGTRALEGDNEQAAGRITNSRRNGVGVGRHGGVGDDRVWVSC